MPHLDQKGGNQVVGLLPPVLEDHDGVVGLVGQRREDKSYRSAGQTSLVELVALVRSDLVEGFARGAEQDSEQREVGRDPLISSLRPYCARAEREEA